MLQRPDAQSFTRFAVSAGVFFLLLAFVGPGLTLRETRVLQIKQIDLASYTPTARRELERRQNIARDVGGAAIPIAVCSFLIGLAILVKAVPRLKRQEDAESEKLDAEIAKLRFEVVPQDDAERQTRLHEEAQQAAEDEIATNTEANKIGAPNSSTDADTPPDTVTKLGSEREHTPELDRTPHPAQVEAQPTDDLYARVREIESRVLTRVTRIATPEYQFQPLVRIETSVGSTPVKLDGLLVAQSDRLSDVGVEIKYLRAHSESAVRRRARAAKWLHDSLASSRVLRDPILWLIVVTETAPSSAMRSAFATLNAQTAGRVVPTIIEANKIEELQMPVSGFTR